MVLYFATKFILRGFFAMTGGVKVNGLSNVPKRGPLIIVSNHQSLLDPLVLMAYIPRRINFLAATYLFKMPVLNVILPLYGAIPVKSGRGDLSSLKKALHILKGGGTIALFPEGGVSPDGKFRTFEPGFAYLALKSGTGVLPVAVKGTRDVLPVGTYVPRRGRIKLRVGEVFVYGKDSVNRGDRQRLSELLRDEICNLMN